MSADLVAFLRARLDEEWAAAKAAGPDGGEWFARDSDGNLSYGEFGWWVSGPAVETEDSEWGQAVADHIARHDPARVLRQVDAGRAIVERADRAFKVAAAFTPERLHRDAASPLGAFHSRDLYEGVLLNLAAIYSDHPDYRKEWAL